MRAGCTLTQVWIDGIGKERWGKLVAKEERNVKNVE